MSTYFWFDVEKSLRPHSRLFYTRHVTELLQTLIDAIRELDPSLRTIIAGLAMVLETSIFVGLVVPGDTIALVASLGVSNMSEFAWLVIALVTGAVIGESLGFALGRWAGPRLRASRLGRRLGERNWRIAEHYLGERGGSAIFFSRFLPVLHSLIPLTAGMAGMRYRRFLAWTSAASLLWALLVVGIGSTAAVGFEELAGRVQGAGYIFVALILLLVFAVWWAKRLFLKREQSHLTPEQERVEV